MIATYDHRQFDFSQRAGTVSVVVPAKDCAPTIGPIATTLADLVGRGAIDQALVVDADSADGTADVARGAGVDVVSENDLMPEFGPAQGKGDAMWRSLSAVDGEVVCFLDGDSGHFGEHYVAGTIGPLAFGFQFVKAFFRRPFRTPAGELPDDGGRVTELTARPLLRRYWPELAGVRQPLAGEMAAPRDLLLRLPFSTGYAVETALLLDVYAAVGAGGIAQVDLEVRQNDHKPLPELAPMADEVLAAASVRLARDGRLADAGDGPLERPPMADVLRAAA